MARRVFFSFHYDEDAWRASQIRNSGVVLPRDVETCGFIDAAAWQEVKRKGDDAIRNWINSQMKGTTVTVVLIGTNTANRPWVNYEIRETVSRGNGLLGVHINWVKDQHQQYCPKGANPFDHVFWAGTQRPISGNYSTYDWVLNDGRENLGKWIEAAARDAGK